MNPLDALGALGTWVHDHFPSLGGGGGLVGHDIGNGQTVYVDPQTGTIIRQFPDGSIGSSTPGAAGSPGLTTSPSGQTTNNAPSNILDPNAQSPAIAAAAASPGAMADWQQFLVWLGALTVLWFVLVALAEGGMPGAANGLAALLLGGGLIALGPKAITNAQSLIQPRKAG